MDYFDAFMAIAENLSDIRRRLIALEAASCNNADAAVTAENMLSLVERIEELENHDWNSSWESEVESLIESALQDIDWEDKVRDAFGNMSFSVVVD
jgi:hypothetical protein